MRVECTVHEGTQISEWPQGGVGNGHPDGQAPRVVEVVAPGLGVVYHVWRPGARGHPAAKHERDRAGQLEVQHPGALGPGHEVAGGVHVVGVLVAGWVDVELLRVRPVIQKRGVRKLVLAALDQRVREGARGGGGRGG
eukprot:CAMPEP_0179157682 /NCGR_PEP_ID=MMETSP0796-20121207/76914_1 /TAXON_ID=73915 /ORGANISM="Pyrodinium bahamense, Strain pbaha01" /LENGTH=137 /DNA_ID=CAMNT_0020859317 /DNA_START=465 /DNA_END=874 /DNA_ORIENTATION=-